jgi:hypothetical protein
MRPIWKGPRTSMPHRTVDDEPAGDLAISFTRCAAGEGPNSLVSDLKSVCADPRTQGDRQRSAGVPGVRRNFPGHGEGHWWVRIVSQLEYMAKAGIRGTTCILRNEPAAGNLRRAATVGSIDFCSSASLSGNLRFLRRSRCRPQSGTVRFGVLDQPPALNGQKSVRHLHAQAALGPRHVGQTGRGRSSPLRARQRGSQSVLDPIGKDHGQGYRRILTSR